MIGVQRIAISGTRSITPAIERQIIVDLMRFDAQTTTIITGACLGVDAFAARAALRLGFSVHTIVPADPRTAHLVDSEWRRACTSSELMPPGSTNKARNQRLVDRGDMLLAYPSFPEHHPASRRSGTWQTVRLARKAGTPVRVRTPQSTVQ